MFAEESNTLDLWRAYVTVACLSSQIKEPKEHTENQVDNFLVAYEPIIAYMISYTLGIIIINNNYNNNSLYIQFEPHDYWSEELGFLKLTYINC